MKLLKRQLEEAKDEIAKLAERVVDEGNSESNKYQK